MWEEKTLFKLAKGTAVAHILGHKYRILGHSSLCSIYETKNGFGKNMACL